MEAQMSFGQVEYARKKKTTRREKFLAQMEQIVPWGRLVALIKPHYPTGRRGRPPVGIERMLRIYFLQQWYALADEALEDSIYDSQAMRNFAGIDLSSESVPDATTLLHFRHLLEAHELTKSLLEEVNAHLEDKHLLMRAGTLVDATIIAAPSSTKNQAGTRDPDMHQAKKGNQWHFGMKAHIGADAESGLVHTVVGTAANVSDISQTHELLHGQERTVHADAGYLGVEKRPRSSPSTGKWSGASPRVAASSKPCPRAGSKISRWGMRSSRPVCARWWNIRSISSRTSSGIAKRATEGSRRTPHNSIASSPWPIWSLPGSACSRQPEVNEPTSLLKAAWRKPPFATLDHPATDQTNR
jgi:transposase, IS5 family